MEKKELIFGMDLALEGSQSTQVWTKLVCESNETDIVIPLGTESRRGDQELKYALRAIEKYLMGYRNVFIVGHKRRWLKEKTKVVGTGCSYTTPGVIYIDRPDTGTEKQRNIFLKLLAAAKDERVSETFAVWNDDHYILQPMNILDIKYWYYGTVELLSRLATGTYQRVCVNSNNYLKSRGYGNLNFDIHTPILYKKQEFIELENEDWAREHIIKSLYCNRWGKPGVEMKDLKFSSPKRRDEIRQAIEGRTWFSISETGTNEAMMAVLDELYPEKSIFEV